MQEISEIYQHKSVFQDHRHYRELDIFLRRKVDQWYQNHYRELIRSSAPILVGAQLVVGIGTLFFVDSGAKSNLLASTFIGIFLTLIWRIFYSKLSWKTYSLLWLTIILQYCILYAQGIREIYIERLLSQDQIWFHFGFTATSFFLVISCPFYGIVTHFTAFVFLVTGMMSFPVNFELSSISIVGGLCLLLCVALSLNSIIFEFLTKEAITEFERQDLIVQNERLKHAALQKDLLLAREIQDSFLPPQAVTTNIYGFNVHFFKENSNVLGGDWMALRRLKSGELIALVIDATGKGTSAALVVHAVQSLWVRALNHNYFDIDEWLININKTLFMFGAAKNHTATIGMLKINEKSISYYSCGHIPAFLSLTLADGSRKAKTLVAGGNMVGISSEFRFGVMSHNLTELPVNSIFLGTDGVFPKGTRTSSREILSLDDALVHKDVDFLKRIQSHDDKFLIWITKSV